VLVSNAGFGFSSGFGFGFGSASGFGASFGLGFGFNSGFGFVFGFGFNSGFGLVHDFGFGFGFGSNSNLDFGFGHGFDFDAGFGFGSGFGVGVASVSVPILISVLVLALVSFLVSFLVSVMKKKPELFEGLVLFQQPAAIMDEITQVWAIENLSERVPQAAHERDLFSAALSDTSKKAMHIAQQIPTRIASKMPPVFQLTDTDLAIPRKRRGQKQACKRHASLCTQRWATSELRTWARRDHGDCTSCTPSRFTSE
jgi:hypothetical protein